MGHEKTDTGRAARASLAVCALALWFVALAPAANATPLHNFLEPESLSGLNHACGVATDTEGDVYVASAGESKVKIFNPAHTEIGSVTSGLAGTEPCGLAVDTNGNLYVTEKATHKVVKYHPTAYPFSGSPNYELPPTEVDKSGNAQGIAVDPSDNRLYVAEGTRIASYNPAGVLGEDEVQKVRIGEATGGSFRLAVGVSAEGATGRGEVQKITFNTGTGSVGASFTLCFEGECATLTNVFPTNPTAAEVQAALEGLSTIGAGNIGCEGFRRSGWWCEFKGTKKETNVPTITGSTAGGATVVVEALSEITASISYEASVAAVQSALEAVPMIGASNVSVEKKSNSEYLVTFVGALASQDIPWLLVGDPGTLSGGTASFPPEVNVTETAKGWSGHIGEGTLTEASGVGAYTHGAEHYVFAADSAGTDRVYAFGGTDFRTLALKYTIDGKETPAGSFTFSPTAAYLGVDQADGHVFVYDHAHLAVDEFEATGQYFTQISKEQLMEADPAFADAEPVAIAAAYPHLNEVQSVKRNAGGGSFRLAFEGSEPTTAIPYKAEPGAVQRALEELPTIGAGNVFVGSSDFYGETVFPYRVVFRGALAERNVSELSCDGSGLTPGGSTCTVATERDGSGPGGLYVTSGAGAGAKALAFGVVTAPSREPVPKFTFASPNVCGTVVDSHGDIYVAGETKIRVFDPEGDLLTTISDTAHPCELAVDSEGNLYASEEGEIGVGGDEQLSLFAPSSYPPISTTTYSAPKKVIGPYSTRRPIAVDPADDHLFVGQETKIEEYGSAAKENPVINPELGKGLGGTFNAGVDVCAKTGDVYASGRGSITSGAIYVIEPPATPPGPGGRLTTIDGSGSLLGPFPLPLISNIAVDQSNCHVLTSEVYTRGPVEEYDASGAFVSQIDPPPGGFSRSQSQRDDIAVDNACYLHAPRLSGETCEAFDPNNGSIYLASHEELYGFGPLSYGEPPVAVTGLASKVGGGNATLGGTVDPRGFEIEDCHFEYLEDASYQENVAEGKPPFEGATPEACAESPEEIGHGIGPVPVHVDLNGLEPQARYRYRLGAENKYGACRRCAGEAGRFGPPLLTGGPVRPIRFAEATVNATVDPFGLPTTYRVRYGASTAYESSTLAKELPPIAGPTAVKIRLSGLAEGTEYHYCLEVENEAQTLTCEDQTFVTQERPGSESCPNEALRTGFSAHLPDCRAYELVSPPDTRGLGIFGDGLTHFRDWMVTPSGPHAGQSVLFDTNGTLPGEEGNGHEDMHEALRGEAGWSEHLLSPSLAEGGVGARSNGFSPDHAYSFWKIFPNDVGSLPEGTYLRTPEGFEALGQGSLGTDPNADGKFISSGGDHVIFSSADCGGCPPPAPLEPNAPPEGTVAIYDRRPGKPTDTRVASLLPGSVTPQAGENADYAGTSEDGSSVAFKIGGTLYVRRDDAETIQAAEAPNTFAGLSADGERVFYAHVAENSNEPGSLYLCDLESGSCAGPDKAQEPVEIAPDATFVNVSANGSHVYFSSAEALTGAEENERHEHAEVGKDNLYLWDGSATRFVAVLDPGDLERLRAQNLLGNSRSRTTPDGKVLVFESRARLTSYDNTEASAAACGNPEEVGDRCTEVYRYDTTAGSLLCASCDPSGAPPTAEVELISPFKAEIVTPNVTADGEEIVFGTGDALLPEDANAAQDVYEWQAQGVPGCKRPGGCLRLISSGQGETDSSLYSMTPDGHDVLFTTLERLVGSDLIGTESLYDARVGGGFPEREATKVCEGDACQGRGTASPSQPGAGSEGFSGPGNESQKAGRCPRGKHRIKRHGTAICVKRHRRHHKDHRRHAKPNRRHGRAR